jgi:mannose-6-phosphate isomerase-like protein (cupin superfamily)
MVDGSREDDELSAIERLLNLKHGESPLSVAEQDWRAALASAAPDPVVGIRHAKISGDPSYGVHVASIPSQVGCHVHRNLTNDQLNHGDEVYVVLAGKGVLHFGKVDEQDGRVFVRGDEWRKLPVRAGDSFVLPAGYAHQLRRDGPGELTILFACPDAHLKDDQDRTILPNAPK